MRPKGSQGEEWISDPFAWQSAFQANSISPKLNDHCTLLPYMKFKLHLTAFSIIFFVVQPAHSTVIVFTDRSLWEAAVGASSFTEDFQGFATDTVFRTSPLSANGFSIQQEGFDHAFRNMVDVPPTQFMDNNGTSGLALYTNFDAPATPGTTVGLTFNQPNIAFGGESTLSVTLEGAIIDVISGSTVLASIPLASGSNSFRGYLLTGGDTATSLVFRSASHVSGSGGQGFGYDNLAGVNAVPEPSTVIFSIIGCALLVFARRSNGRSLRHKVEPLNSD